MNVLFVLYRVDFFYRGSSLFLLLIKYLVPGCVVGVFNAGFEVSLSLVLARKGRFCVSERCEDAGKDVTRSSAEYCGCYGSFPPLASALLIELCGSSSMLLTKRKKR